MLVEQNPKLVFDLADDIVILNTGRVAVVSTPAQLENGWCRFAPAPRSVLRSFHTVMADLTGRPCLNGTKDVDALGTSRA